MPIDKAKESAAIAAVNEQINHVGRTIKKNFSCIKKTHVLDCSYYWGWIRFNNYSSSEKNW
jgi:hypothetical protein